MAEARPWAAAPGGLTLRVRLTPRGGRARIEGVAEVDGRPVLRARVAEPPVDGAANAALERLVARALGVRAGAVAITGGQTGRVKTLSVEGDADGLAARLAELAGVAPAGD